MSSVGLSFLSFLEIEEWRINGLSLSVIRFEEVWIVFWNNEEKSEAVKNGEEIVIEGLLKIWNKN
jgi:hypothetical protein